MALRDALVTLRPGETADDYLGRAMQAAIEIGGLLPRLRLEYVVNVLGGTDRGSREGCCLWVAKRDTRAESWQRLTVTIYGGWIMVADRITRAVAQNA